MHSICRMFDVKYYMHKKFFISFSSIPILSMHLKIVRLNNLPRRRLKYQEVRTQMERKAICRKEEKVKKKEKEKEKEEE